MWVRAYKGLTSQANMAAKISFNMSSTITTNGRPAQRKPWNPVDHGLSADFVLTNFTELKGCGCKVPQAKLLKYLEKIGKTDIVSETPDVSVRPIRHSKNKKIISTIDFFTPNVQDPYFQGRIACCNVLSDLYSMAVTDVDVILMVLAISTRMSETEKEIVTSLIIEGFNDCATQAGTFVLGGQTIFNPSPIIGGVGIAAVSKNEFLMPNNAVIGDSVILTKPLGAQLAVNSMQWVTSFPEKYAKISHILTKEQVTTAFNKAQMEMGTLSLFGAHLMKKYHAHAATDVTGFGIKGHSQFLASVQKEKVDIVIDNLPVIKNMAKIDNIVANYKFTQGLSAETSGGLLVCLPKQAASDFIKEMHDNGLESNFVGTVVKGSNNSVVVENASIEEIA